MDFKGSHFEREIVLWGVRWYVAYPISYRQLEEMMGEGSVASLPASPETWQVGDERNNGWTMNEDLGGAFKGRHFTAEVILWALRWYLAFPVSYRDLALMLSDRGVAVDHATIFRWVQAYAAALEKRLRRHLRPNTGSWRVDETYITVKGAWTYLYRAVDSLGQTIDFLLSPRRDAASAKRFFRKALAQVHTGNPRTITVDKNPAYPRATAEMKRGRELWRFARLQQCKYLNNIVEQDHRRIKRLVRPGLGFGSLPTARRHWLAMRR